ncbi:ArsR/SmtB family transcription factor [Acidobacteriota bacterium]
MKRSMEYFELHAEVCKTFGHPKRLMIISTLREGEFTVTDISDHTAIDLSNLSQHLHILRDKGLVSTRREGTKVHYSLSHPNIGKALDLMSSFLDQKIANSVNMIKKRKD